MTAALVLLTLLTLFSPHTATARTTYATVPSYTLHMSDIIHRQIILPTARNTTTVHAPIAIAPVQQSPAPTNTPSAQTSTQPAETSAPIASNPAPSTQSQSVQTVQAPTAAPIAPSASFSSQIEAAVLVDMNAERAKQGVGSLAGSATLASVARAHSGDMLIHDYFSHTDQSGCDAGCRITRGGYAWMSYGENIHMMSGYNFTASEAAAKIVADWMASPPHRENLLNGTFTEAGVGIAVQGTTIYTTADYALPR